MGVLEELARARTDYERGDWAAALDSWSGLVPDEMGAEDLRAAAITAYLVGRRDAAVDYFQRAFHLFESAGDHATAARCCFHLGMILGTGGEPALAAGWGARAGRLVEGLGGDVVEGGYVAFLQMHGHLGAGDWPAAAECADEASAVARRHHDPDLLALGLVAQGRLAIYAGRVAEGLARLDESMAGAAAGEVSPIIFGNVYCTAIEGCQEISEFGRVAEWTSALHRWCAAQPGLVAYTGQCSVHRGQVMRLRGAWTEALEEFALAIERYRQADSLAAIGLAEAERGDVLRLRGDYDAAEAAYQRAGEHGHDPQPGLALLWLARGSGDAAAGAVRRLLSEVGNPTQPCRLLPAAVDVLLAVGALDEARTEATVLDELARKVGSASLLALAAYASAAVELASGDPAGAMPYLRKARQLWARADSPYESARVRLLTGRAFAALGDEESARQEAAAARQVFLSLGAAPAVEEADRLLRPAGLPAGLTAREAEVLRLVAAGHSNTQIASDLVLSEKTVARHLSNIFGKLDVGSRTAAAAYAFEQGLV
jgi:ATP/maltotriose-dependent transcriptional regulator MalT